MSEFHDGLSLRLRWQDAFETAGIPSPELFSMSESEFAQMCDMLSDAGFSPSRVPDSAPPSLSALFRASKHGFPLSERNYEARPPLFFGAPPSEADALPAADRGTRDEQDRSFQEALARQRQREAEMDEQRVIEAAIADSRERTVAAARTAAQDRFRAIGPEPEFGIKLAVALPSRRRIFRKFTDQAPGADIFAWVAHEEELCVDGVPIAFELVNGVTRLDGGRSLKEQGITRQSLFTVMVTD
jgi:hypothetical protein